MKSFWIALLAGVWLTGAAAGDEIVTLPGALPSGEACESAWSRAQGPEEAASIFIAALITYEFDEDSARDCLRRIVDIGYLDAHGELSRDFEYLIDVGIDRHAAIARSYVVGATPDNGYALPEEGWPVRFTRDARFDLGGGEYRVKVHTSGQPTSRPVTLRRDENGHYRINEASTLFVGVAAPR